METVKIFSTKLINLFDCSSIIPTKKGVTFAPDQLDILSEAIEEAKTLFMEEAMEE